jgi:hypothetical protein
VLPGCPIRPKAGDGDREVRFGFKRSRISRAGSFSEVGEAEEEAMSDYYFIKKRAERVWIQKLLFAINPWWIEE